MTHQIIDRASEPARKAVEHVKRRAVKRYGIALTIRDQDEILRKIHNGVDCRRVCTFLKRRPGMRRVRRELWAVDYRRRLFAVVVTKERDLIVTVLPLATLVRRFPHLRIVMRAEAPRREKRRRI